LTRLDIELVALRVGKVWLHDDDAAVAVWFPSEMLEPAAETSVAMDAAARECVGEHLARVHEVEAVVRAARPKEPHWYLGTMGTRPERQRQGGGQAVLRPMLDRLDDEQTPACLETSLDTNVLFYETLGFESVVCHRDLPHGAPDTWVLWRPPARRGR
jgi:GNAT superfamily N-acetyltransferase